MNRKFLLVAGTIAGTYFLIATIVVAVVLAREYKEPPSTYYPTVLDYEPEPINKASVVQTPSRTNNDKGSLLRPPAVTNFLFIGIDENKLADAIMVAAFYRDSGEIRLMSIPRDMYTNIPTQRLHQMQADGLRPPATLKINAVRAFGGYAHGIKYLKEQLSEMLGVQFHYHVEVELDAFRRIVDAIGGVSMHVPRRLHYHDPQQGLVIDIPAGQHHLNGHMAENFVRFRSFPTGDLMRNTMQIEFMSQLIKQVTTREAIMNDPLALARIILSDVRTDAGIVELAKYVPYISRISDIQTFTLPGSGQYIDGISWFIPDTTALPDVVSRVFYASPEEDNE